MADETATTLQVPTTCDDWAKVYIDALRETGPEFPTQKFLVETVSNFANSLNLEGDDSPNALKADNSGLSSKVLSCFGWQMRIAAMREMLDVLRTTWLNRANPTREEVLVLSQLEDAFINLFPAGVREEVRKEGHRNEREV